MVALCDPFPQPRARCDGRSKELGEGRGARQCTREGLPVRQGVESSSFGNSGLAVNMINMAGHNMGTTGLVLGEKPENALCEAPGPPGVKALAGRRDGEESTRQAGGERRRMAGMARQTYTSHSRRQQ